MPLLATLWWVNAPGQHDHQPEHGIDKGEYPKWRLKEYEPLQPVLDETFRIAASAGLQAQPRLQRGQRAPLAEPGLDDDEGDGREMRKPEPPVIDPTPAQPVTNQHGQQSANDKHHDSEVQHQHGIGKELV